LLGYKRHNEIGFRNHILVIPSVFCSNKVCIDIAEAHEDIIAVEHSHGCGQIGKDLEQTKRTLIGTALNPNVYGVIIVGLGCEDAAAEELGERITSISEKPVHVFTIQDVGDTEQSIKKGKQLALALLEEAKQIERVKVNFNDVVVGVIPNGIEKNTHQSSAPLLQSLAEDLLKNGTTIVYGDSTELMPAYERLLTSITNDLLKKKLEGIKGEIIGNESSEVDFVPKNAQLTNVLKYAELCNQDDKFVFMNGPNHNLEQITGLVASGAHIVVQGTAEGNLVGSPAAPVLKVSGTNDLFQIFTGDIDFNAGELADNNTLHDSFKERLKAQLIKVLNGTKTKSEEINVTEFGIQRVGPSI